MIKHITVAAAAVILASASGALLAQNAPPPSPDPLLQPPLADATTKENPPKPIEGQIIMQDKDTYLASAIIGSWVRSKDNETIGDVNDVIINPNGDVEGVVIGVGGFLGMGEKDVAVALNRLTISQSENFDSANVMLNVSLAELEAAPAFKTAYAQKLEDEAGQRAVKDSLSMNQVPQTVNPAPATQ
jgi:hypothetical protein